MFFKNLEDFKTIIPLTANFNFPMMENYLRDIDRTVLMPYLGEDFLTELQENFDEVKKVSDLQDHQEEAVKRIRVATAHMAVVKWLPVAQVNMSNSGIHINTTDTHKQAFQWQIKDIERSYTEIGFNALDDLLDFLEKNINSYNTYAGSDEYAENSSLFISTAKEFTTYCSPFKTSCVNFTKIRSVIKKVEDFHIKPTISPDYYDELKSTASEDLGELALKIISMIKPALANLAFARSVSELTAKFDQNGFVVFDNTGGRQTVDSIKQADEAAMHRIATTAERDGLAYLDILAKYLEANKDDYPAYKNDSGYIDPADETDLNDGSKPFFTGL